MVQAVNLAYEVHGEGMPLALLHGFHLNRSIWRHQQNVLEKYFRVIAVDLRGHGESPDVTAHVS
jgi:pimeloyl-ACP methyl ester carboxylesterase